MSAEARPSEEAFQASRSHLLGLAYRMLGSFSEAEDIVQEAWIRWRSAGDEHVVKPLAFLRKLTARLCLDQLKSARRRREHYVGTWLPEPVPDYAASEIDEPVLADDITMSLLLAMERLSPAERAAFLLHDIFDLPFAEIASILDKPETACRQLATRGRKQLRSDRKRFDADRATAERLTTAFLKASQEGDAQMLQLILADDVIVYSDGGGKRPAALNLIRGREKASRFFLGIHRKRDGRQPSIIYRGRVNGAPGYISLEADGLPQAVSVQVQGERIGAVYIVRNPEKLRLVRSARGSTADRVGEQVAQRDSGPV
jgi:RNA polymerase sigma-70 factor, ECF subfamily